MLAVLTLQGRSFAAADRKAMVRSGSHAELDRAHSAKYPR